MLTFENFYDIINFIGEFAMVRFNMSQLNSKIRQAQQKQRQAIAKINREIKAYNQDARRAINN